MGIQGPGQDWGNDRHPMHAQCLQHCLIGAGVLSVLQFCKSGEKRESWRSYHVPTNEIIGAFVIHKSPQLRQECRNNRGRFPRPVHFGLHECFHLKTLRFSIMRLTENTYRSTMKSACAVTLSFRFTCGDYLWRPLWSNSTNSERRWRHQVHTFCNNKKVNIYQKNNFKLF